MSKHLYMVDGSGVFLNSVTLVLAEDEQIAVLKARDKMMEDYHIPFKGWHVFDVRRVTMKDDDVMVVWDGNY